MRFDNAMNPPLAHRLPRTFLSFPVSLHTQIFKGELARFFPQISPCLPRSHQWTLTCMALTLSETDTK